MTELYCSRGDVNGWIADGNITQNGRLVAASAASTDTFELDGHGFETDAELTVRAVEGSGGSLPSPLVAGTIYFARRLTTSTFQIAATAGGSVINLTTDGASVVVTKEPPFDKVIKFWSRWADSFFPAHVVPFDAPVPDLVAGIVAKLSAYDLMGIGGKDSTIANNAKIDAVKMLERHAAGMPIRDARATAPTNLAVRSTTLASEAPDPRGWGTGSLP